MVGALMIVQAFGRPEARSNTLISGITIKPPANLSYNDLRYILQARNGVDVPAPKTLSPCARAILGCCKDNVINESCSEALKCGAYFFDDNPCDAKFIVSALKEAKTFYTQLKTT